MKIALFVAILSIGVFAQNNKPRVFITDSQSWELGGGGGGVDGTFGSGGAGGARPQTAEIVKTFGARCPAVITNNVKKNSDYVIVLDHEGGKSFFLHDNKVAVFERISGDTVMSKSTLSLGGSVQAACDAIARHWSDNSGRLTTARLRQEDAAPASPAAPAAAASTAVLKISVSSTPDAADIEIDGSFVGNTPSTIDLDPGEHEVVVRKAGFQTWQRKLKLYGGDVHLVADLEKAAAGN